MSKDYKHKVSYSDTDPMPTRIGVCGKRCYSKAQANHIINIAKRTRGMSRNGKYPRRVYWCKECCAYHTTHLVFSPDHKK